MWYTIEVKQLAKKKRDVLPEVSERMIIDRATKRQGGKEQNKHN